VAAQSECGIALSQAVKSYQTGGFDRVMELLEPCRKATTASRSEKVEIHRLLAMTYITLDLYDQSEAAVRDLLRLKSNFETTLRDPPKFIRMVEEAKIRASNVLVTSVSKNNESLLEAPATVIVLNEEEIERRGYLDLEALLHDLPGFDISRGNGVLYSNIYQRGYRSNGTDRTLFLFDGVEENDLWTNFAHISRQYPLSDIKRVEVIYGPGSTMYGPNAYVGVVNIITKQPEEVIPRGKKFGTKVQINGGTWNTRYVDAVVAGVQENIAFSLTGRMFRSNERDLSGFADWDFLPHDAEFYKDKLAVDGLDAEGRLRAERFLADNELPLEHDFYTVTVDQDGRASAIELTDLGAQTAANLDRVALNSEVNGKPIKYTNSTDDWFLHGKLRLGDLNFGAQVWRREEGTIGWFPDDREGSSDNGAVWIPRHAFFYIKYDKSINDNLQLTLFNRFKSHTMDEENKILIFRSYAGEGRHDLADLANSTQADWAVIYFSRISKELRSELKALYSPNERFSLVSGLELRNGLIQVNYVTSFQQQHPTETGVPSAVQGLNGDNHHNQLDLGVYSQASYKATEQIKLTLGGRLDNNQVRETEGYGTVFNSRAAVVYTPSDFVFKAIYSEAFKAASNWVKFSTSPSRQLSNPDLDPEKVRNVDLNLGWRMRQGIALDLVGYWAQYSDIVGTAQVVLNGAETTQNQAQGKLRIRGIQMNGTWDFKEYRLFGNYTFTDPVIFEDAQGRSLDVRMGDIARHRVNLGVNALFREKINLNLRLNRVGKRQTGPGTSVESNPFSVIEAYTVVNGTLSYDGLAPGLGVQLIIHNLFDQRYFHPGVRSADGKILAALLPQNTRNTMVRFLYQF